MHSIFKTILSILLVAMIAYTGIGVLWAYNAAVAAEQYLNKVTREVSTANLRTNVLDAEVQDAKDHDYELSYETMDDNHGTRHYVSLTLKYKYTVGIAALSGQHQRTATAY